MASASAVPSSSSSSSSRHRTPLSVVNSGMKLRDVYAITRSDDLAQWLRRKGLIGDFTDEDCVKCNHGKMRLVKDASYSKDKACWRCSNRQCNSKVSIRRGTWFESSHLSMSQVLELTYFWVYECTEKLVMRECDIATWSTVVDLFSFCREVCGEILEKDSGGPGEVVEVDESKFGKRKYNRGRSVDGVWVFGGIDRRTRECFLIPVKDRTADTLIPLIKQYIRPGTTIMTDCWKSYSTLQEEGYIHGTVNHSYEYVNSVTGDNTQMIESTWRVVKQSLPKFGTTKEQYDSYFEEFMFRRKYFEGRPDHFLAFLEKVASVYTPSLHR